MELVVLHVKRNGTEIKAVWSVEGSTIGTYTINLDMINEEAKKIRNVLDRLVERALSNNNQGKPPACGDILKELATCGADLYNSLFTNAVLDGSHEAKTVKQWLEQYEHPLTMKVIVEPRIHIPWGLIYYDRNLERLSGNPEDTAWELFQDFWGIRYDLSCLYYRISPAHLRTFEPSTYRMLPVVNKTSFANALERLPEIEKNAFRSLFQKFDPPVYSKQDLFARWQATKSTLGMLFFYCHADQTRLALDQDQLDIYDFKRKLRLDSRQLHDPPSFVFLNGCRTAIGDPSGGFLEATGGDGYCGFIGTEAEIPDLFALRFSTAFMYSFYCEGLSILETMKRLRRQHWPVSVLYSTCCEHRLTVKGLGEQEAFSTLFQRNFSAMQVGSQSSES